MECPVCFNLYSQDTHIPVVLPCGHSLCKECASSLKSVENAIACPQCRKSSPLSSELPLNYSILDQLSIQRKSEGGEEEDKCELHQTKRVKFFCGQCEKFFCSKCVVLHTSEGHQIEAANVQIDRTLQQLSSKFSLQKTQLRDAKTEMVERLALLHKQREAINQGYEQLITQIQRERDNTLPLVIALLGKQEEMIHRTDEEEKFATEIGEELTKAQHSKTSIKAKHALIEKATSGLIEEGKKQELVDIYLEIKMMEVPSQGIIQVTPIRNSKNPPNPRLGLNIDANVVVAAYGEHSIPGSSERLQERIARISAGISELRGNLQTVEACQIELNAKVEHMIATLREYLQVTISKLQLLKADLERMIDAAIQEAQATVYLDKPILKEKLARELWDFGSSFKSLKLFTYEVNQAQFPASLDDILHYSLLTISGEIGMIPGIKGQSLRLYDPRSRQTQKVSLPVKFTRATVYCIVEGRTVMCVGGEPSTSKTFSLSLTDYQITVLHSMHTPRSWSGILSHDFFVYVFGGIVVEPNESVSCEKYSTITRSWSQLPDMRYPRCGFSPCLFEGEIYLPGIFRTHTVLEAFNLTNEEFRVLPVPLPHTGYDSVSYILNGELIMITRKDLICRWKMESTERNFRVSNATNTGEFVLSNCPPVLVGKDLYWVQNESGNLHIFNLEKSTVSLALW